jgi:DNA end-binding protein Ku
MAKMGRAALAELVTRGKEQLVLIRPYQGGLMMHTMYYANEVRNFREIPKAENAKLSDEEIQLGADLIESMSDEFEPDRYKDEYRIRVARHAGRKEQRSRDHGFSATTSTTRAGHRSHASAEAKHGTRTAQKETCRSSEKTKVSVVSCVFLGPPSSTIHAGTASNLRRPATPDDPFL